MHKGSVSQPFRGLRVPDNKIVGNNSFLKPKINVIASNSGGISKLVVPDQSLGTTALETVTPIIFLAKLLPDFFPILMTSRGGC